jgi:hypothetical protein
MKGKICSAIGFLVLTIGIGSAAAQMRMRVVLNVPFEFHIAKAKYPAGQYAISQESPSTLKLTNLDSNKDVIVPFITRLAARNIDKPELVFDKDGNDAYLSEIHVPRSDGFFLQAAPGKHEHVTVGAGK